MIDINNVPFTIMPSASQTHNFNRPIIESLNSDLMDEGYGINDLNLITNLTLSIEVINNEDKSPTGEIL